MRVRRKVETFNRRQALPIVASARNGIIAKDLVRRPPPSPMDARETRPRDKSKFKTPGAEPTPVRGRRRDSPPRSPECCSEKGPFRSRGVVNYYPPT